MNEKKKPVHGGNEDGIGIAQDVGISSTEMNDCDSATSNVGKTRKDKAAPKERHE